MAKIIIVEVKAKLSEEEIQSWFNLQVSLQENKKDLFPAGNISYHKDNSTNIVTFLIQHPNNEDMVRCAFENLLDAIKDLSIINGIVKSNVKLQDYVEQKRLYPKSEVEENFYENIYELEINN